VSQSDGYLKCVCQHCGGHIEFPSEGAGRTVECPHCRWSTVLVGGTPVEPVPIGGGPETRKKIFRTFFIAAFVVIAAGAAVYWYWRVPKDHAASLPAPSIADHQSQSNEAAPKPPAPVVAAPVVPPDPWHGLVVGPISLEKATDGHLVYAVGKLRNTSDRQRFGVKVELDVFNAEDEKIDTATDYAQTIDPGKEWKFKALVTDRAAKTAKLTAVTED
jgi:hypothetical protein